MVILHIASINDCLYSGGVGVVVPDEVLLVIDGPLTNALDAVIENNM